MKNFKLFEKCNRRIARRVTLIAVLLAMCIPQLWATSGIKLRGDYVGGFSYTSATWTKGVNDDETKRYWDVYHPGGSKYWRIWLVYYNHDGGPDNENEDYDLNVGTSAYMVVNKNKHSFVTTADPGILRIKVDQYGSDKGRSKDEYPYVWVERPDVEFKYPWDGTNWTKVTATDNHDGTYTYRGTYRGVDRFNAGPNGADKIAPEGTGEGTTVIIGSPTTGRRCEFKWQPGTGDPNTDYKYTGGEEDNRGRFTITKLCTITYYANGGTGDAPDPQEVLYGADQTLRGNTGGLSKDGYVFVGWNTNSSGTGDHYDVGATLEDVEADVDLYAEWVSGKWGVKGSGGDGALGDWNQFKVLRQVDDNVYRGSVSLGKNQVYEFKITDNTTWYGKSDISKYFLGQTNSVTLSSSPSEANCIIATGNAGDYTFEFDESTGGLIVTYPNGNNHPSTNFVYYSNPNKWGTIKAYIYDKPELTKWENSPILGTPVTISGASYYYTALGDRKDVIFHNGSGSQTSNLDDVNDEVGHYYNTSWAQFTVRITLNNQSATSAGTEYEDVKFNYDELTTSITCPTKTGYNFGGYYTETNGGGVQIIAANGAWIASVSGYTDGDKKWIKDGGTATLYAKWKEKTYSVTAAVNPAGSGFVTPSSATTFGQVVGGDITASPNGGYDFYKWSVTSGSGTIDDDEEASTTFYPTATSTVTAQFCPEAGSGETVFKFDVSTTSGNVCSSTGTSTINESNFSTLEGGYVDAYVTGTSQLVYATGGYIRVSGSTNPYLILNLDCPLKEGDIIKWYSAASSSRNLYFRHTSSSTSTGQITLQVPTSAASQMTRITDAFDDVSTIYITVSGQPLDIKSIEIIRPYSITLDANTNGGTVNGEETIEVTADGFTYFPRAVKSGKHFKGWYTASSEGDLITEPYLSADGATLYAQFDETPSSGDLYSMTVKSGQANADYPVGLTDVWVNGNLSAEDGGSISAGCLSSAGDVRVRDDNEMQINSKANGYWKIDLEFALQANDVISFTSSTNYQLALTYNSTRSETVQTSSKSFTIPSTGTGADLAGKSTLYLWRVAGSGTNIATLKVSRPAAPSCTAAPTVSAATKGATTTATQVVNCAGISSLGTGDCEITSYGFVYGTSANPTTSDNVEEVGTTYTTTNTAFSKTIESLTPGATYYVRAYATNGYGTAYGTGTSFTTHYAITTGSHTNGSVTIPSSAAPDASVAISATPSTGYSFSSWTIKKTSDGSDVTASVSLSGTTSATFTMPDYAVTVDATFSCTTPTIGTNPSDATVCKDATKPALTVAASANGGTLSYQWYSNTTKSTSDATLLTDSTKAKMYAPTGTAGTKYYYCVVTNTTGGCSATSDIATVTVKGAATITWGTQPSNGTVGDDDFAYAVSCSDGSSVTVTSNNTDVATIVGGKLHYVAAGTTYLIATATDACGNEIVQNSSNFTVSAYSGSSSINLEQGVLDHGTSWGYAAALTAANISYDLTPGDGESVSLDNLNYDCSKTDMNNDYRGLKIKSSGKYIEVNLAKGNTLKVRFGHRGSKVGLKIDGAAQSDISKDGNYYTYSLAKDDANNRVVRFTTKDANAVVIKQIMIGEDIADVDLPAQINIANGITNGSISASSKANVGSDVTVTVTPSTGYELATLTYQACTGDPQNINLVSKQFEMPNSKVTLNATFVLSCTDPGLTYATSSVTKTLCDASFTNPLTNTNSVSVSYESSDTDVAEVASDGTLTIKKAGTTTITASSVEQTVSAVTYCADNASYTLTVNASTAAGLAYGTATMEKNVGDANFTNTLTNSHSLDVTYESSNTSVATVAANGEVTIKAAGTTTITAHSAQQKKSTTCYAAGSATYTLTVYPVYTVTYNAMGGTCSPTSTNTTTALGKVTLPSATHASYTTYSWVTSDGTEAGDAGDTYTPEGNINLYAKWSGSCAGGGGSGSTIFKARVKTSGMSSKATELSALAVGSTSCTTDNYLSELIGTLSMTITKAGNVTADNDSTIKITGKGYVYFVATLSDSKTFQAGDIITMGVYGQNGYLQIGSGDYSSATDLTVVKDARRSFLVPNDWIGESTFYIKAVSNGAKFAYVDVYRPGETLFFAEVNNGVGTSSLGDGTNETEHTAGAVGEGNTLAAISGGKLYTKARVAGYVKAATNEIQLTDGANDTYIKLSLDRALAEGDKIIVNSSITNYPLGVTTTGTYSTTNTVPYTIPAESGMIGEKTIYLWRNSSNSNMHSVAVIRNSGGSCYTVTYDGNGATGGYTNDPAQYAKDADPEVLDCGYTRTGYAFMGWADGTDHRDAETVDYQPGDIIEDISSDVTLYAIWKQIKYFTGAASTTSWNTDGNWSPSGVPDITDPVVIQANVTVDTDEAKALSVDIESGNTLTINAGMALIIAETLTKNGGATAAADVIINSTRAAGTGALVMGSHDGSNAATVNFETKVRYDGGFVNQYLGSPFSDETPYVDYEIQLFKFVPAANGSHGWWNKLSYGNTMDPFMGYNQLSNNTSGNYLDLNGRTGHLNASTNVEFTIENGKMYYNSSWPENMFANSWTAPIHIDQFEDDDFVNVNKSIYIFNAGTPEQYAEGGSTMDGGADNEGAGTYSVIPVKSASELEDLGAVTTVIPAMQAFSVMATSSNPSLRLDFNRLVYTPALTDLKIEPTRAPRRAEAEIERPDAMRLRVRGENGWTANAYILGREDFTNGYDDGWDGEYMEGDGSAPQLYAATQEGYFVVNCVPEIEGTLMAFHPGSADNTYTLSFVYNGSETWYLNDMKEQTSTLISNETNYPFVSVAGDNPARFVISKIPYSTTEITTGVTNLDDETVDVQKVIYNDKLYIIRGGKVFSADGHLVK